MDLISIPGYKIDKKIGSGGMAEVFLGHQLSVDRQVAIKIMSSALAADESFAKRFMKEANIASLVHPNIITVHDAGKIDNSHYIIMEYVSGGDLCDKIHADTYSISEKIEIIKQIASALGYSHDKGIVHRDVKPENILFREDGTPVLADFGIAKAMTAATNVTAVGMAIGSPFYMSPEQARGEDLDGRSDIYSLGVVFYEILTGKKPFTANDTFAVAVKHINDDIPFMPPELAYLQPVIDKLLAKDPESRYQNTRELIDELNLLSNNIETSSINNGAGNTSIDNTVLMPASELSQTKDSTKGINNSVKTLFFIVTIVMIIAIAITGYLSFRNQGDLKIVYSQTHNNDNQNFKQVNPTDLTTNVNSSKQTSSNKASENITTVESSGLTKPRFDINEALESARSLFQNGDVDSVVEAHTIYQKVLNVDSTNQFAIDGVNEIYDYLFEVGKKSFSDMDYIKSKEYLTELYRLNKNKQAGFYLSQIETILNRNNILDEYKNKTITKIKEKDFFIPEDDSAYYYIEQILKIDPQSEVAKKLIKDLLNNYLIDVKHDVSNNNDQKALNKIKIGLSKFPDDTNLLLLEKKIIYKNSNKIKQAEEQRKKNKMEKEIALYLQKAEERSKENKYLSPENDCVLHYYKKILKLDPVNKKANNGIYLLALKYKTKVEEYIEKENFSDAEKALFSLSKIPNQDESILSLKERLKITRESLNSHETIQDLVGPNVKGPLMVIINPGEFIMGDIQGSDREGDEKPLHKVNIDYKFAIGRYEVTFDEFDYYCKENNLPLLPDHGWGRGNRPVAGISWNQADEYTKWLSRITNKKYRLPSESEWEYVARAGTDTRYFWGNSVGRGKANCKGCGKSINKTLRVGSFKTNQFGVNDMHGNVWEWVLDCWNDRYDSAPDDGSPWLSGECDSRMLRGGSWDTYPTFIRSANRDWFEKDKAKKDFGFRLVREIN